MTDAAWVPTTQVTQDQVSPVAARALHDLLNLTGPAPHSGDALPLLWHWLAFLPQARQDELGPDGHPLTGTFLPPAGERQRMYAGGAIERCGQVTVGQPITRTSVVSDWRVKQGRSGELMFVTVNHLLQGKDGQIRERQDIVYRLPQASTPPAAARTEPAGNWTTTEEVRLGSTLLFRFSALTYNAHRIHYDREYATGVEGYPGLVVHGPLQAVLLASLAERSAPDHPVDTFSFRATAPAFDHAPLQLRMRPGPDALSLDLAAYSEGRHTMTASARFQEAEA